MNRGLSQQALTLILPVRAGFEVSLRTQLENIEAPVVASLARSESIHTLRFELLPRTSEEGVELAIETLFDGTLANHVNELVTLCGEALSACGSACSEATDLGKSKELSAVIAERTLRVRAAYWVQSGRSVRRIREFLSGACSETHSFAVTPERRAFSPSVLADHLGEILPVLPWVPWFELQTRLLTTRNESASEPPRTPVARPARAPRQARSTPFTAVLPLRNGSLRMRALLRTLTLVDAVEAHVGVADHAGGLSALHSLRFVLLPRGRLLVTGACDGSVEFLFDRLAENENGLLSALFMHTRGFPPTTALVFGGARRDSSFALWRRGFRGPDGISYCAYRNASAPDLRRVPRDTDTAGSLDVPPNPRLAAHG
jgi:hypothetical protein